MFPWSIFSIYAKICINRKSKLTWNRFSGSDTTTNSLNKLPIAWWYVAHWAYVSYAPLEIFLEETLNILYRWAIEVKNLMFFCIFQGYFLLKQVSLPIFVFVYSLILKSGLKVVNFYKLLKSSVWIYAFRNRDNDFLIQVYQ